jgi:NAD(P)-dependent dehydrogenase (short-subunit alcohol dehydrogenase family)
MLAGLVVVVTGGGRGIGLATGTAFARVGARVVLGDIDESVVGAAAAELPTSAHAPGWHLGLWLDVRQEQSCRDFLDATKAQCGRIDVLVNCAGIAILGDFADLTAEEQELQLEVNLHGVVRMTRLVLPDMLRRRYGYIVNIASAVGVISAPRAAVYGATKHAVVGLTESLRWETRLQGVRVSAVLPTVVSTEMAAGLRTPGLPVVSAVKVAAAVLRVVRRQRPPAVVLVPRWFAVAALVDSISPGWVRDLARRYIRVDDRSGNGHRKAYLDRVSRQMNDHEDEK